MVVVRIGLGPICLKSTFYTSWYVFGGYGSHTELPLNFLLDLTFVQP